MMVQTTDFWKLNSLSISLLPCPLGGRTFRDIEVHDPAAVVGEYYQTEQHSESYGRHHQEINRYQVVDMIVQKRFPRWRW